MCMVIISTKVCVFIILTDLNLNELENTEQDEASEERQSSYEQGATTSLDPPVIITSSSRESLPRISTVNFQDQEGHRTLAEGSSVDLSSSISSIASFKSHEGPHEDNILTRVYFSLPAENSVNKGISEERKKVTFACQENGLTKAVKRRATSRKCSGSAVKQTDHTLIRSAGSSWFSQSSWDEPQENGNEENDEQGEDVPGRFNEEMNQSTGLDSDASEKDSDPGTRTFLSRFN